MNASHRRMLGIRPGHRLVQRNEKIKITASGAEVTYWYWEVDENGRFVARHVLTETPGGHTTQAWQDLEY